LIAADPVIVPDTGTLPVFAVYVKDLAAVLANALTATGVEGAAYHLAQTEIVSVENHVANIARLAGIEMEIERIPSRLLERLGFNLRHFPYYSSNAMIVLDTTAARRNLQYAPTPYATALRETIEYFIRHHPDHCPSIEDLYPPVMPRARERTLIDRYRAAVRELEDRLTDEWLNEAMPKE